jgi:hypothetical protein
MIDYAATSLYFSIMAEMNDPIKIEGSLFKFISFLFKKHDVHGVLVGGYALIANKVQRATFDIDFLIGDARTVGKIISRGKTVVIAGESFIIPSVLHLIEMKLHSIAGNKRRELKDFPDIAQLLTANGIDPAGEHIKELFGKYRLQDLYSRLMTVSGGKDE